MAAKGGGGGGLFALYGHEEILKKSSSLKLGVRIWNNFTRLFLVWPFSKKNCSRNFDPSKNMAAMGGSFFHCVDFREILQNSSPLKPLVRFWNNFTGLLLGWLFSKMFAKFWSVEKHGHCGGDFLHYMHMKKSLKNLLWNRWLEFGIISQDCFLRDSFKKLFANIWSVEKYGPHGGGFFHCVDFREILQDSSPLKLLVRFWINLAGLFFGDPFQILFAKFLSVNKHGINKWGLLAPYKHIEILVNSSLKATKKI